MTSSLDARVVVRRDGFALDAALAVAPGETIAVMGPSGAGKSTLLGALAGLVPLDDGRIAVGGRELSTPARTVPPARRRMVLLSQDPHLFPHLSALDNVAFGPRARGVPRSVARARAQDWLDRLGVGAAASRRPDALSGGQRQRVALARAIVTEPDVLLLDEPSTSLDPLTAQDVRAAIASLPATTTVLATHHVADAVALAARLCVLEAGHIVQLAATADVLAAPATAFSAALAGEAGWLRDNGAPGPR
ncbi:MAG: hypothetical protein CMH36_08295 [Microbacterium sp.]|uniref:Sulfate/thiosulfate import ATP-binding protein CysA n=3 Tax=Microbacterium ginsengisoli TaxID=400772 RepID=A0A0F0LWY3_9MICO|nr:MULTISPECIES: ATP-binding cassette domain-containing protein [Microbacterium]KJL36810.1 Sulfate/thiosulfate import ATP-binding protein CysA [Microbacterium ginsengisoli]MAL06810.1 hypothetical protein [Microbacterium sp.]MBN9208324.1 ATP-binding cassette domain-containing protein [Microbacterium ginsengisoli]MCK9915414.1 ATP-binding cassette domain-containing protein [Microbacteriaceae bacterium K1510]